MYQAFDYSYIRLSGFLGGWIQKTIDRNLLCLNLEKDFLAPFVAKSMTEPTYVALGKTMDALVHFAAIDARLLPLKQKVFDTVISAQEPDGYIGTMAPGLRVWTPWDCHDENYIAMALFNDYRHFGAIRSREAGRKLLDCIIRAWPEKPEKGGPAGYYGWLDDHMITLGIEHAMLSGYEATKDQRYLDFVEKTCGLAQLDWPITEERHAPLWGHIYCYMSHALAQLRLGELTNREPVSRQGLRAEAFLFRQGGMSITGGAGKYECWTSDQDGRGDYTETCSSAYLMRYLFMRLRITGSGYYADVLERILYNSLLAAQSPDGRNIRYYTPFEGCRRYMDKDTFCCPGNFRRILSKLPQMTALQKPDELAAVLYTSMTVKMNVADVPVQWEETTDYPAGESVKFSFSAPQKVAMKLSLRIPAWCTDAVLAVNSKIVQITLQNGFCTVEREWNNGDQVELTLPMPFRWVRGFRRQHGLAALMRGPRVFTLDPEQVFRHENTVQGMFHAGENFHAENAEKISLCAADAADLREIRVDEMSVCPGPDGSADVIGDLTGVEIDVAGGCVFRLTPFADPAGKLIYFHLNRPEAAVQDELFDQK